jgi:hypothetical protein
MDRNGQHTVAKPCDERDGDEEEGHGPSGNHRSGRYTSTPRTVNRQRQGQGPRSRRPYSQGLPRDSTWSFRPLDVGIRPRSRQSPRSGGSTRTALHRHHPRLLREAWNPRWRRGAPLNHRDRGTSQHHCRLCGGGREATRRRASPPCLPARQLGLIWV